MHKVMERSETAYNIPNQQRFHHSGLLATCALSKRAIDMVMLVGMAKISASVKYLECELLHIGRF